MSEKTNSTRRSFLKSGAALAAPLVVATPAAVLADDGLKARLARLEDEAAIRNLHETWLRRINSGARDAAAQLFAQPERAAQLFAAADAMNISRHGTTLAVPNSAGSSGVLTPEVTGSYTRRTEELIRSIAPDHSAAPDVIEVAQNGTNATAHFHCIAEIEIPIPQDSTLGQMAHAQGSGFLRRTERRILHAEYVKANGAWSIAKLAFAPRLT